MLAPVEIVPPAPPIKVKQKCHRTPIGIDSGKKYYWAIYTNSATGALIKEQLEWKVPDIREAIEAEPGMRILSSDYSQVEVKLMAFLSGDKALIEAINSGKDVHSYNAVKVFGARMDFDYELLEKARKDDSHPRHTELSLVRSRIKTTTFGVPYGAGPQRVALMCDMYKPDPKNPGKQILDVDAAQEFIDEFFKVYHVLKAWLDREGENAINFGFSCSPRGRRRFYLMPSAEDPDRDGLLSQIRRWAGNMPIQAGNVDMLKPAMRQIYRRIRERWTPEQVRILFVVHDEIVMTCREDLADEVEVIMKEEMEKSYQDIIHGVVVNKIDVSNATTWKKA